MLLDILQAVLSLFFYCFVVCLLLLSLFTLDLSDYLRLSEIVELEDLVASVCCALSSVFLFKSCRFIIGIYGLFFLLSLEIYGKSIQGIVFQGKVVGQIAPIYKLLVFVQLSAKMSTLAHIHSHTNFYKEFAHKVGRPAQLSCKTAYSFRPCYKITQFKGRRNDDTFMEEDEKQISDLQSELIRS